MERSKPTLAIVVGGGPAPGINGVISALTIEAINHGFRVLGIEDGFKWLAAGDTSYAKELELKDVTRIYYRGGSILGTSRANPDTPEKMQKVINTLAALQVNYLATIGGDDTAFTSGRVEKAANGKIKVVHVPKTIDNDLPLPGGTSTFGFQTARHYGVEVVQNLMEDARTTRRWYIVLTMGRKAGHLALGIGKAASAPVILIPEEFAENVPIKVICDIIDGAILKRKAMGRPYGVVVMAEGMIDRISREDLAELKDAPRDPHNNIRYSEINLAKEVAEKLRERYDKRNDDMTLVWKNVGYELRCAPPIPFDREYTRDLGYAAMQFLINGDSGAMISIRGGKAIPMGFDEIIDAKTGKTRIRLVDIYTESYRVAKEYEMRLDKKDLSGELLEKMAQLAGMTSEEFVSHYGYITGNNKYMHSVACGH